MDDLLGGRRGVFRIGVMLTALSVLVLSVAVTGPGGQPWWPALAIFALLGATGGGLLVGARLARVAGGLLFMAGAVLSPFSLIQTLVESPLPGSSHLHWILSVANAIASTLLLAWLCLCAGLVLSGSARRTAIVSARIAGVALVLIAASHLWLALQVGFEGRGAWSIALSTRGTQLIGFPGWPIWHLALLATALFLLAGPRRTLPIAATVLTLLFGGLIPLVTIAAAGSGFGELPLLVILTSSTLLPVYLSWWLRDALQDVSTERAAAQ